MTGWGQTGPLAQTAGHDLGYVAITGALFGMGQDKSRPHFPTNLVGDFGGGSTYLVIGILAALLESRLSGEGQVVDAAIVDGTAHLNAMATGFLAGGLLPRGAGRQPARRRRAVLRPLRDGRRQAPGGRRARAAVLRRAGRRLLGIADTAPDRNDPANHPELRRLIARRRTRPDPGRVGRGVRRLRRLRRAGAADERGVRPSAPGGARHVRRARRDDPAGAGSALLADGAVADDTATGRQAGQDTRDALTAWGIADVDALLESGAAVQAMSEHVDVLIIGAGLSGIGAAAHLTRALPRTSYVVLEAREVSGGTWDLFRYPGIRSDSDMYTMGYALPARGGTRRRSGRASGSSSTSATPPGSTTWSGTSATAPRRPGVVGLRRSARWTVEAEHDGRTVTFTAGLVWSCRGYYDYERGHRARVRRARPSSPGRSSTRSTGRPTSTGRARRSW